MIQRAEPDIASHEPADYVCPFCAFVREQKNQLLGPADLVRQDAKATAFISPRWWPNNHGHALVVPNVHVENLYEIDDEHGLAVHTLVREVAVAIRTIYGCTGISTRQHNEPDGNQDVWHFHVHVFPRYPGDRLYQTEPIREMVPAQHRRRYAEKLSAYFAGR